MHPLPPDAWRARCESHLVVAEYCLRTLGERVRELESGLTESEAALTASAMRADAYRAEASLVYEQRTARRAIDRADGLARAYVRDLLAAADEAARLGLSRLERAVEERVRLVDEAASSGSETPEVAASPAVATGSSRPVLKKACRAKPRPRRQPRRGGHGKTRDRI